MIIIRSVNITLHLKEKRFVRLLKIKLNIPTERILDVEKRVKIFELENL